MATFPVWNDWRAMARDIRRGISKLTIAENFNPSETTWRTWDPRVVGLTAMTVPVTNVAFARYLPFGNTTFISFDITFTTAGATTPVVYISVPKATVRRQFAPIVLSIAGVWETGLFGVGADGFELLRAATANFPNGTHRAILNFFYETT